MSIIAQQKELSETMKFRFINLLTKHVEHGGSPNGKKIRTIFATQQESENDYIINNHLSIVTFIERDNAFDPYLVIIVFQNSAIE